MIWKDKTEVKDSGCYCSGYCRRVLDACSTIVPAEVNAAMETNIMGELVAVELDR